ncbi:homing endonuclease associated repeat-containing protein [Pseudodesulfovibrio karagichevae]|uniref:Homing endonuclease associated repeat-containing protein n=1 Tax=Pseudodesulfovibrio karagichevae TaxID=3239305 RepID=A0ABV4K773_9BACT
MKFEMNGLDDYSDDSLLDEVRRVAELLDEKPLRISQFKKHSKVSESTVRRRFGGWEKALLAAGLGEGYFTDVKEYTKSDVLEELKRISVMLNKKSLTVKEVEKYSVFGSGLASLRRLFPSFNKAMEEAGLDVVPLGKRYTDEDCFENMLQVWTYYGRQPKHAEMKKAPSIVGPKAYVRRWGTWRKAVFAFVERVNQDLDQYNEKVIAVESRPVVSVKKAKSQAESREIRLGLRYDILKRDCFKCAICGRSPATNVSCKLEVDHIKPWSKGGLTTSDNLQTLCDLCNRGKSNKM